MAVTISIYDHTAKLFANGDVTLATLRAELLDTNASFTAANTQKTQVDNAGSYEVDGSGWTTGGETLASAAVTQVTTNDAKLDANDISMTATGGAIGPAYALLIYDDTDANDAPLFYIDFGEAEQADEGTAFNVTWDASGICTFTVA